jgi:hypothetical protein
MGLAMLALSSCAKHPPVVVEAPPAPVGHIYQTLVAVPPPTYRRMRITPEEAEQLQQAFNIIGLKSALMVGALSCNQQSRYDTFMTTFQPHILAEQHVMDAYFRRMGRYGQTNEDTFVTLLANNQSVTGIAQGSIFCLNNSAEFDAVLALKTPESLDSFVTDQSPDASAPDPVVAIVHPTVIHHFTHTTTHHVVERRHVTVTTTTKPTSDKPAATTATKSE